MRMVVVQMVKMKAVKMVMMMVVVKMTLVKMVRVPSMPILTIAVCSGAFLGVSPISISWRKCGAITIITIIINTVIVINISTPHLRNNLHIAASHLRYSQSLVCRCCQKRFQDKFEWNMKMWTTYLEPGVRVSLVSGPWSKARSRGPGPRSRLPGLQ